MQNLQKVGVHNYYDLIMASWNNINWVYHVHNINDNNWTLLRVISAYSLYLTSIGDVDKALDPMQWDCDIEKALDPMQCDYIIFWNWKWHDYQVFMRYEVAAKLTPFGMSVLPTPKLISSISKANTTTTTTQSVIRR